MMPAPLVRTLVLWCPDWPVTALASGDGPRVSPTTPLALVEANRVVACSAAARREGVRRGLRRREAQARCPGLVVVRHDPALDARAFEPLVERLEAVTPGVHVLRPGLCAVRVRGPARYYGGERAAALTLLGILAEEGVAGARAGIADGPFTAVQAARRADPVLVVPPGESASFLAPLPVSVLDDPEIAGLLQRLGVPTLGAFAQLPVGDVRDRFGVPGARLHALAAGADSRVVVPRVPPPDRDREVVFEPPLELVDQVAFGMRVAAGEFVDALTADLLVCTSLGVEIVAENGDRSERVWLHPRSFGAAEVVDRVRWQLQAAAAGSSLRSGIVRVRIYPEAVDALSSHERGLWGGGPEERIHSALSRVQSMLGHGGVVTAVVGGGRGLAERRVLVPWGDRAIVPRARGEPWPGHLPPPAPATVFPVPRALEVVAADGGSVTVDTRGRLSEPPHAFAFTARPDRSHRVAGWAGPWSVQERWWDAAERREEHRFQVVDEEGMAWLLLLRAGTWWAEARYD